MGDANKWLRNSFFYLIVLVFLVAFLVAILNRGGSSAPTVGLSTLMTNAKVDYQHNPTHQDTLVQDGLNLTLTDRPAPNTGQDYRAVLGQNDTLTQILQYNNVPANAVSVKNNPPSNLGNWLGLLGGFLPILVFGGFLLFMMRQAQGSNNQALSFGKSRARMFTGNRPSVTFQDVAGVEEAKQELAEVVEFLKYPEKFAALGARIPRGVLLIGSPGTGKTLLARAVAGEAGVPFFSISGSAFVEMYVGVGAARVRDLFAKARKAAPAIVFIDELDAVGGKRSSGARGGNDEREHTLNQLLVEMDGFAGDSGVVVIAATNRPDMLDAALLRPGRFDRRVTMGTPDRVGRAAVLALHTARVRMEEDVDLDRLAGQTSGMAPADLANVVNEAALLAARERREQVSARDLEAALLRVLAGPELKSRVMAPAIKRVIAYHEVGHALVMKLLPHCDPVAKVQAIARGQALGITVSMPAEDQYLMTRSALLERMVGMVSPDLAARIDATVRGLVEAAYTRARALVTARQAALAAIADHLYEVETMDGHELDTWLARYPAAEELAPAA